MYCIPNTLKLASYKRPRINPQKPMAYNNFSRSYLINIAATNKDSANTNRNQ